MLCKNPFVKAGPQVKRHHTYISEGARIAATPFGCGQCLPCRINRARQWTLRMLLEQMTSGDSCFITLTYNANSLPEDGNLVLSDLQKFFKRLRKNLPKIPIRYFACGEYGSKTMRPHYHSALFGVGIELSNVFDKSWGLGIIHVGDLTKDSARYITGYILKGQTRENAPGLNGKRPEFMTCSKMKGGIGINSIKYLSKQLAKYKYEGIVDNLRIGKKKYPLGRYLTHKLNDSLNVPIEREEAKFYDYQEKIFNKYWKDGSHMKLQVQDLEKAAILRMEKRQKIFQQKRSL